MIVKAKLNQPCQRAITFLNTHDCFTSQSSLDPQNWQPDYSYQTNFIPALILNCLVDVAGTDTLRSLLSHFLLSQKSADWSFNYWARQSPQYTQMPYPDDLDDTACSLIALYRHNPSLVSPVALAGFIKLLISVETQVGGPYKTWLSSSKAWQDVDSVVNANIAYALELFSNRLPKLDKYISKVIYSDEGLSRYYSSAFVSWYFLARSCPETAKPQLANTIQASCHKQKPSILQAALALQSICQLSGDPALAYALAQQLIYKQHANGSWPAEGFCLDPKRNGKQYHAGSSALTTAIALQALTSFKHYNKNLLRASGRRPAHDRPTSAHEIIVDQARSSFSRLQPNLRHSCQQMLESLTAADSKHQITLLPLRFSDSIVRPAAKQQLITQLGLANLYGWMAYTIYDDFIDEEGQPKQISVANFCLRQSLLTFQRALPTNAAFQAAVVQAFDTIDGANSWEVAHCRSVKRLPSYGNLHKLAERSWGHSLTPLALLCANGNDPQEPNVQKIMTAFRHYLIARQLDDDAHDWKEDLARGHLSHTVVNLLRDSGLSPNDTLGLQRYFWQTYLPKHCQTVSQQVALGHDAILNNPLLISNNILSTILDNIQQSVENTRRQHQHANQFLNSY